MEPPRLRAAMGTGVRLLMVSAHGRADEGPGTANATHNRTTDVSPDGDAQD